MWSLLLRSGKAHCGLELAVAEARRREERKGEGGGEDPILTSNNLEQSRAVLCSFDCLRKRREPEKEFVAGAVSRGLWTCG